MKKMTVKEWREKHRRCKFCKYRLIIGDIYAWCAVRKKLINEELPRWFCPVFELED